MSVTWRTLAFQRGLAEQLRLVTDRQTRLLVAAWVTAWDEVAPDLNQVLLEMLSAGERVTRSQMLRSLRLQNALIVIADRLQVLAAQAGVVITGDLVDVIDTAGAAQASILDSQLPPGFMSSAQLDMWSRVDARQIEAIVRRATQQITSRTRALSREAQAAVRRELIRGVAAGSNPRVTARRILERVEGRFNGGLTRALNISRTETLDAHRAAAALGQSQHTDVLAGWTWLATLDRRTCPSCLAQHGSEHPASEPGPFDHQQGRCSRLPRTKSWRELGFDIEEPPSLLPDAGQWFTDLPEADQRVILGPGRYAAWADGRFPMSDWSARRTTPGWRDSYGVAPVPRSSGGRVSRKAA
jgi:hypothetical protein